MKRIASFFMLICVVALSANAQIKSAATGNWSAGATWIGGVVPGPSDNVIIDTSMTVTIDVANAACNDLTALGYLFFNGATSGNSLTVNGNAIVGPRGRLRSAAATPSAASVQYLTLNKDLTVNLGGSFDMRIGSGVTVSVGRVLFEGTVNSVISMSLTAYGSSVEEFNSVVINKSGSAKVIVVAGNVYQNNNSTNSADTLVLMNGIIETQGTSGWYHLGTSSSHVVGASSQSYVNGILGRGLSNTGGSVNINRSFEVGDANGYRKLTIRAQAPTLVTGAYVAVQAIAGDANTGSSAFTGGIDKVSTARYYKLTYFPSTSATTTMPIDVLTPEYAAEDGVGQGNTDLRVAYSIDNRATWNGMGQTVPDTTFIPDAVIRPDSLVSGSWIQITSSTTAYAALARATGTTTNSLVYTPTSVESDNTVPASISLGQNYPNPFNPTTIVSYQLSVASQVDLRVFDMLGREVAVLASGVKNPGTYTVNFDATRLTGGMYLYRLSTGTFSSVKKMILMK